MCAVFHYSALPLLDSMKLRSVQKGTFEWLPTGSIWEGLRLNEMYRIYIIYTTVFSYICACDCFLCYVVPPCTFDQSGSIIKNTRCKAYITATVWGNRMRVGFKALNILKASGFVCEETQPTLLFRRSLSLSVSVSAFAMTGTMLTLLWMAFINSTSRGFRLAEKKTKKTN